MMRTLRPLPCGLRRRHFLALRLGRFALAAAIVALAPGLDATAAFATVVRSSTIRTAVFNLPGSRIPGIKSGSSTFSLAVARDPRANAGPTLGRKLGVLGEALSPELELVASASSDGASLSAGRRIWNLFSGAKDFTGSGDGAFSARLSADGSGAGLKRSTEELADLVKDPPAAVFFDYDGTLTDHRSDGLSAPTSPAILDGLIRLLKAGVPVGFVSARSFDTQPDTKIPMELWSVLLSKIPKELRRNVFFSGRVGGELVVFDEKGEIKRLLDGDWLPSEKAKIDQAVTSALGEAGVRPTDFEIVSEPGQTSLVFNAHENLAEMYAMVLSDRFRAAGLPFQVLQHKNWVYFSRSRKEVGIQLLYAQMTGRGFPLTPKNLLFIGDQFKMSPDAPAGGDASMALSFQESRAISVGDAVGDVLPPNARRLEASGAEGSLQVIEAVLQGLAAKPKKAVPLLERTALKESGKLLAVASFVWALTHPTFAAMAGTVALTVLGVPQLVKNFREGAKAVKDMVHASALIWLGASVLLTLGSVLGGSSAWYVVANAAGIVQATIMILQILRHQDAPGMKAKTLAVAGSLVGAVVVGLALAGLGAFTWTALAGWATLGAIVLLFGINFPQIGSYFRLYEKEGRVPTGVSPFYPGLVAGGSLFHLIAALSYGDGWWALNASVAIATSSLVLAQLYFPKTAYAVLRPFKPLARALRRLRTRLRWWLRLYLRG